MRNQIVALKNEADRMIPVGIPIGITIVLGRNAVDPQISRCITVESADDIQKRCLSAAGGTENRHKLTVSETDGYPTQSMYKAIPCLIILFDLIKI